MAATKTKMGWTSKERVADWHDRPDNPNLTGVCGNCGKGIDTNPRKYGWWHCNQCRDAEEALKAEHLKPPTPDEQAAIDMVAFKMGVPLSDPDEGPGTPETIKYPQLAFPGNAIKPGSILDKLVTKACEGGLSMGLVVPAIMTLVSAVPRVHSMAGARINQYCTLFSMVGAGKDTAIDRALAVTGLTEDFDTVTIYSPSGERSISNLLGDKPGTKENPERVPGFTTHCIVTYELEDTLNKARGETSSVLQAMQWLYDHNRKVYSDSKYRTTQTVDCRLSWLTALPVGDGEIDESSFSRAFGEHSSHGIASRMIFGFAEERFDRRRTRMWSVPYEFNHFGEVTKTDVYGAADVTFDNTHTYASKWHDHAVVDFAPGIEQQYWDWEAGRDMSGRDTYHVLKVAIISAIIELHKFIEQSDWDFAVAFIGWQQEIRKAFEPGRSKKITQGEFNERIMREMTKRVQKLKATGNDTKHAKTMTIGKKKFYFIRWKAMAGDGKWHLFGLDTKRTINMLVENGDLFYKPNLTDESGEKPTESHDQNWVGLGNE